MQPTPPVLSLCIKYSRVQTDKPLPPGKAAEHHYSRPFPVPRVTHANPFTAHIHLSFP